MDATPINHCITCEARPESRAFGSSDHGGLGSQTAIIECTCGQIVTRTTPEEDVAMPTAVAAWNAANPE
jgi:hypothetical protein